MSFLDFLDLSVSSTWTPPGKGVAELAAEASRCGHLGRPLPCDRWLIGRHAARHDGKGIVGRVPTEEVVVEARSSGPAWLDSARLDLARPLDHSQALAFSGGGGGGGVKQGSFEVSMIVVLLYLYVSRSPSSLRLMDGDIPRQHSRSPFTRKLPNSWFFSGI
uniref:Uncharacterized protein n=1 Tax=Physcomitrium patens TaxID=3218 RepID=A0A2K1JPF7_PHYPA|nr:hypothetical protein PHYPA_015811 [Physcomitrium patens]